jgi:hypothetical protein
MDGRGFEERGSARSEGPFDFDLAACAQGERVRRFYIDTHQELS